MPEGRPFAFPSSVRATAHVYLEHLDDLAFVTGDDAHHLGRVRRIRAGEVVTAADGRGRWRTYEVTDVRTSEVEVRATSADRREPRLAPALSVACSLTKGDRPEVVVQKLTELGVDTILLLRAARSVVRWDAPRATAAIDRLRKVAREAGAQSRRARLPVVDGPVAPHELVGRPGLVVADVGGVPAAAVPAPASGEWTLAVGPEGGFDDAELAAFGDVPRLGVSPFVLRAETAALAGAAALAGRRAAEPAAFRQRTHRVVSSASGWYSARGKSAQRLGERMDEQYVGDRLRAIRRQKGLSLHDVEGTIEPGVQGLGARRLRAW